MQMTKEAREEAQLDADDCVEAVAESNDICEIVPTFRRALGSLCTAGLAIAALDCSPRCRPSIRQQVTPAIWDACRAKRAIVFDGSCSSAVNSVVCQRT